MIDECEGSYLESCGIPDCKFAMHEVHVITTGEMGSKKVNQIIGELFEKRNFCKSNA